jgi:acetyltransferase-like isoleucine patch superfamily enzyme
MAIFLHTILNLLRGAGRALTVVLPWPLKRRVLQCWHGYQLHPSARLGWAWVFPRELVMGESARIDHFTVAIHLERMELGAHATIGRGNWITGFPKDSSGLHFRHQPDREPVLVMGEHSAVTKHHHLDCTARIDIGAFATIAGYQSQFLTHSIDLHANRQHAEPIRIGRYCFVGTRCVVLGGAGLPDRSVLGAASLLNKTFEETGTLYGGSPARPLKQLPPDSAYFHRTQGFVE